MVLPEIIIAAFLIMLASLGGVLFTSRFAKRLLESHISYFVSFTAGVFLVTATALGLEAFAVLESSLIFVTLLVGGYALAWGMHYVLPETHHHHDESCPRGHGNARRLVVGDAIHNVADGIILVPAFLAGPALGIAAATSIVIHEVLQEISEFIVLRQAGYSTRRALTLNFAVSATIFIGVGISWFALANTALEGALLALAAGFFGHVVVHDLLPTKRVREDEQAILPHLFIVAIGAIAMGGINVYLTEEHAHGDTHGAALSEEHEEHADDEEGAAHEKEATPHDESFGDEHE